MYDTMKDKRIGTAEVIEKFGVGPDKVIEVQALIGDSTDNVPGVPGIGVKTAAQLIGEYGDLETLLKRAGEIKQDKRRQSLIDNAEIARISKRLVTLDHNVPLDVPVDRARGARARLQEPDRLPEGDGIQHHHPPRRREGRDRCKRRSRRMRSWRRARSPASEACAATANERRPVRARRRDSQPATARGKRTAPSPPSRLPPRAAEAARNAKIDRAQIRMRAHARRA